MNFKRLIALTVVIATLFTCAFSTSVFATAYEVDTRLTSQNGMLKQGNGENAVLGYKYSRTSSSNYTITDLEGNTTNATTKTPEYVGYIDNTGGASNMTGNYSLAMSGYSTGYIASHSYTDTGIAKPAASENDYYYAVSYSNLQMNYNKYCINDAFIDELCTDAEKKKSLDLQNNVFSLKYNMYIPEETKDTVRTYVFPISYVTGSTKTTDDSTGKVTVTWSATGGSSFTNKYSYDAETGKGSLVMTVSKSTALFELPVEVETNRWYEIENRFHIVNNKLVVALYVDGVQVSAHRSTGTKPYEKGLMIGQVGIRGSSTSVSPGLTYYDEFSFNLLAGLSKAPATEYVEPEVPEEPALISIVANDGVATATLLEGADVENATLVVALYDAQGNFEKLVLSSDVVAGDGCKTITCNIPSSSTATNYKAFLFDSLISSIPLAQHIEGPLN